MPPSWTQRFLPNPAPASTPPTRDARSNSRDKPLPTLPSSTSDTPTPPALIGRDGERSMATPTHPPRHQHARSSSHPLPKLFSKMKSAGNLHGYNDTDVPLDEDLVPVLDDPTPSPNRKGSGKKPQQDDDANKTSRRCMCCDSRVKVPRELEKFRCMCCLTINDLAPVEEQQHGSEKDKADSVGKPLPLSVERAKGIIDRCVVAYLDSRCRKEHEVRPTRAVSSPLQTPEEKGNPLNSIPIRGKQNPTLRQLVDAPLSSSPPDRPLPPKRKPPPPPTFGKSDPIPHHSGHASSPNMTPQEAERRRRYDRVKTIFRPLEDHIVSSFGTFQTLNTSFSTFKPAPPERARSESHIVTPPPERATDKALTPVNMSELDAKTLLLGDIGENGTWWTGKLGRYDSGVKRKRVGEGPRKAISSKSPDIHWSDVSKWYGLIHSAGSDWQSKLDSITVDGSRERLQGPNNFDEIEYDLGEAREHAIRALLKVTENLLKRPTRPLKEAEDLRFLLIILANPSLYPSAPRHRRVFSNDLDRPGRSPSDKRESPKWPLPRKPSERQGSQHTGILKRIFGLLAGSTDICHRYMIGWFSRFDEVHFTRIVDLVASFVTHRISRRGSRPQNKGILGDGGLIPDLSGSAMNTSAQLHSAMGLSGSLKKRSDDPDQEPAYATDWQIKAAAKVMLLLFAANNIWQGQRRSKTDRIDSGVSMSHQTPAKRSGQLLHTSSFYNTLLDYQDMIVDFKVWESKKEKFAFCQYPLFLSMGNKIKILEYDARRQMEIKAREAYFDSVIRFRALDGYFHLRVRRDCMVEDSLRQISEAVGAGQEELKKGLRVQFTGEEGVDAGGLRKEWFLMLVRDIFDPNHGLFVYDDESRLCYFNPNSFETSDQYYLVGALLGLAIYNSTILDIALPPFAFRKLLAAAPASTTNGAASIASLTGTKGQMTYTLADLAELHPSLAAGLQQLLDFEGDVQETYCRDFVAPVERYGVHTNVPLVPNGARIPVTNTNRQEFVDAYVRYLLDTAVAKQFEPFKRGFFQVCAGNALSLFRAEEIELLVRGSDEALDIDSLRAVAVYENWRDDTPQHAPVPRPADIVPVIQWFWELFSEASPEKQRQLLTFVTGTDRIPAVGATSLILRIVAGGDGWGGGGEEELARFPIARTCFNMLVLWPYASQRQLEEKLWRAVEESEGFGLK
ncbi:hypothetical protein BDY17DRAFT_256594 [Neohortaea acidophila]|uniref:HECT-type E3 ubiquitin transferase n=1 Tax=Neohortaea acidophila TaxID=245834 RepID=A0A6A6PM39_9PEZI|nr:uncharacterized protein BDY17DRAFT_256594 [Neohortaea acidophila]KAF2480327.1 hypothetical protein BDY17DRAFT_256594 [Neohortaea acidophila]